MIPILFSGLGLLKSIPKQVWFIIAAAMILFGVYRFAFNKGRTSIPELELPPETISPGTAFVDTSKWIDRIRHLDSLLAMKPARIILPVQDSNCQKYVDRLEHQFSAYQDSLKPFLGLVELALSYPDSLKDTYLGIPGYELRVTVYPKRSSDRFKYNADKISVPGDNRYSITRENFLAISPGLGYNFDSGSIAGRLELEVKSWSVELIKSGFREWRSGWSGFINKKIFSL